MEKVEEIRVVYVTSPTMEDAKHIAKILITEKLAACCSIIQNVTSFFGWQNVIQERNEYLIIVKTMFKNLALLENRVLELSVDEVPEIISLPVAESHKEYYNWMLSSME